ncbi:MAG: threonine--tRNA ligase [Nitrospirae bacterium]|nr:threonine--tRNA ligase [Nitrospirota bacterium]
MPAKELNITLPDQTKKTYRTGITACEILREIGGKSPGNILAVKVNGMPVDINRPLTEDAVIELITFLTREGKEIYRHSTSHILALCVKKLFPDARLAIGPAIEDGFYYDFDLKRSFTQEDLEKIEAGIMEIIDSDIPFVRKEIRREEAIELFRKLGEPYKVEILEDIADETITVYQQGDFIDLCLGPHVPSSGKIGAVKLLSIAGAYWKGDEKRPMLQRVYGTSFPDKSELDSYLKRLEEIKKRDHRRLGRELDLFSISDDIGPGLVLWHPKGAVTRRIIEDFWKDEHYRADYEIVYSPHVAKLDLWGRSGHLDFYRENMYAPMKIDEVEFELKPMNCPFHIVIYKSHIRSYKELPIRWAELGTVYRYERSGVLHGLLRVRGFTQDDAHIFCMPDQLEAEISGALDLTLFILKTFGFDKYEIYLSTRPEKYVGTLSNWEKATSALERSLKERNLPYQTDPGEGVFYGPKIDIKIKDVLQRAWQCTTIQVDFNLPERFDITFVGEDGKEHRPIMIHRALMGSLERFFGILIEHYAGAFPLWLSPVQTIILPITDREREYSKEITERLRRAGIRSSLDDRNEKVGLKIREATLNKIPYMLIIGAREVKDNTVSIRKRSGEDLGVKKIEEIIDILKSEIGARLTT